MTSKTKEDIFISSPVFRLLSDAIMFCFLSRDCSDDNRHAYARASILNSAFCVEGVANVLLLACTSKLTNDDFKKIDRKSALDKFEDFMSLHYPNKVFERGRTEIQAIAELFTLRDENVHSRIFKYNIAKESSTKAGLYYKVKNLKYTNILHIPCTSLDWISDHSICVLKAVNSFLDLYFLEYYGMSQEQAYELLSDKIRFHNGKVAAVQALRYDEMFIRAQKEIGLKLKCFIPPIQHANHNEQQDKKASQENHKLMD